ncbi:hypothetical protein M2113_000004 [Aurantimicrobium minutum]|nr:hypothetical protein [Aurantimicrobium minutum]
MYCTNCGSPRSTDVSFCSECGTAYVVTALETQVSTVPAPPQQISLPSQEPVNTAPSRNPEVVPEISNQTQNTASRATFTVLGILLGVALLLFIGIQVYTQATGVNPVTSEVTLDSARIEQAIADDYAGIGVTATVECPDPMVAKPGESRNCIATYLLGLTNNVAVTVQNSQGDVTWAVQ